MYQNGYQQYKVQSVSTMTRGEMLLLLYDEILKRLNRAELALEEGLYDVFEQSIVRCQEIIRYLNDTLNTEYAISRDLYKLYDFFMFELGRIQAGRNKAVIEELKPLVAELRDAFAQASKKAGI